MDNIEINIHTDEAIKAMEKQIEVALNAVGLEAEGDAKVELESDPRRVDTGRLRNSVTHLVTTERGEKYAVIGTNVEYGKWVHEGTGIYAVNGDGRKTGWWYTDDKGESHFTRGMHPNRFLRNAIEKNADKYKGIINEQLKKS